MTACTPNATPAPLPAATSSPVVTETAKIDMFPAGFGLSPTSSPEAERDNAEFFKEPTTADAAKYMGAEATISEQIVDVVSDYMDKMEKKRAEIALSCVAPESELKFVFKDNGQSGEIYRWTIVAQAGEYTCWSLDAKTGKIAEYPTYFDPDSGELMSVAQGVQWERLEGKFTFAGKTAALGNPRSFVVPAGLTGSQINDSSFWKPLAVETVENLNPISNPLSEADTIAFNVGGYQFDAESGTIRSKTEQIVATTYDGINWFDSVTGSEIVDLRAVLVNGVDYQNNPIGSIPTRVFNGEPQVFNTDIGEWVRIIDLKSGQAMMDSGGAIDQNNWGTFENVTLDGMPEITEEEAENGTLFYNIQLNLREKPDNVRDIKLQCFKFNTGNYWFLSQFPLGSPLSFYVGNLSYVREPGEMPINRENDPVQNVAVAKFKDDAGAWNIVQGLQYWMDDLSYIQQVKYWGENADPTNPEFINTRMALTNPRWKVVMPWCNDDKVIALMPAGLQQKIAEEEKNPTPPTEGGQVWDRMMFPIDSATMARLQEVTFEDAYMEKNPLGFYLAPLSEPGWRDIFPEMDVPGN